MNTKTIDLHESIRALRGLRLTYREIAYELDCSIGSVHKHINNDLSIKINKPKAKYINKNDSYEKRKDRMLKARYGISLKEYIDIYNDQNGSCLLCLKGKKLFERAGLQVDHDHDTGVVRGLLCPSCNTGIGRFENDMELFNRVSEYLRQ